MAPPDVPAFKFFRKGRGVSVFVTGHQNLIKRLYRTDIWMKEQVYLTQERIGRKLVADAKILWNPSGPSSGSVARNIAYEQKELMRTYRLSYGLSNARATRGSQTQGSSNRQFGGGAEGTISEASHGVWIDKGTGVFGLHERPYPSRRKGVKRNGEPYKMMKGFKARPFISASYTKNRPWIDEQYRQLNRRLKLYIDTGAPPA